jgi:hypothetical protein
MKVIIPDVHQNVDFCEAVLHQNPDADEYIFLGDFFDSYLSVPQVRSFRETCEYVRNLMAAHPLSSKFTFLVGNHDMAYIFHNTKPGRGSVVRSLDYFCSGVTKSKISTFRKVFFDEGLRDSFFLDKCKLAYRVDGWTFSHAGIVDRILPANFSNIDHFVNVTCRDALFEFRNLMHAHNYLLSAVGESRYGAFPEGGLIWCDWRHEFQPSDLVGKQVCGHTTVGEPDCKEPATIRESWNLDAGQAFYGILRNGNLTVSAV